MVPVLLFLILITCLAMLNVWTVVILLASVAIAPIVFVASVWVTIRIIERF